jgi:hypothetical protein
MWAYPFGLLIAFCVGMVMGRTAFGDSKPKPPKPPRTPRPNICVCGHHANVHSGGRGACYEFMGRADYCLKFISEVQDAELTMKHSPCVGPGPIPSS